MEIKKAESLQFTIERRGNPRFLVELPVEYRRPNKARIRPGHTLNFSEDGFLVLVPEQMEIGEELEMKIYFSPDSALITIEATVKIVWGNVEAKEDGYYRFGVRFLNISPVDREMLKAFLNLYADPHRSPAELKAPAGSRFNPSKPSAREQPGRPPAATPPPPTLFRRLLGLGSRAVKKNR